MSVQDLHAHERLMRSTLKHESQAACTRVRPLCRHKEPTEWEDLQRKYGNLPPKEEVWKPEKYAPAPEVVKDKAWIDGHQEAEELSELEDEFADDRFMEQYRCSPDSTRKSNCRGW